MIFKCFKLYYLFFFIIFTNTEVDTIVIKGTKSCLFVRILERCYLPSFFVQSGGLIFSPVSPFQHIFCVNTFDGKVVREGRRSLSFVSLCVLFHSLCTMSQYITMTEEVVEFGFVFSIQFNRLECSLQIRLSGFRWFKVMYRSNICINIK